jgi:hypothetical protein
VPPPAVDAATTPRSFAASLVPSCLPSTHPQPATEAGELAAQPSFETSSAQSSVVTGPTEPDTARHPHAPPAAALTPAASSQPAPSWYTPGPPKPKRRGLFAACFGR